MLDKNYWYKKLGLFPVSLYRNEMDFQKFVLFNGNTGNFCMDNTKEVDYDMNRNIAWSSDVNHYLLETQNSIEVIRWDQPSFKTEKYSTISVTKNLEKFYDYLSNIQTNRELSVVGFINNVFRKLRSENPDVIDSSIAIKVLILLLITNIEKTDVHKINFDKWGINKSYLDNLDLIKKDSWDSLLEQLNFGIKSYNLSLDMSLALRHALAKIFQESHYIATFDLQQELFPQPIDKIRHQAANKKLGVYYTPAFLARSIVEEALKNFDFEKKSITIFDPACGSGEFLKECLRQLDIKNFKGTINLLGNDVSEIAINMSAFTLAYEKRMLYNKSTVNIELRTTNSVTSEWPKDNDIVIMNPPFVSWENMTTELKETVSKGLGQSSFNRPDLSSLFLLKASSVLNKTGTVAALLPASILGSKTTEKIRETLSSEITPRLIGKLGDQTIFHNAIIDSGIYIGNKEKDSKPTKVFWSDYKINSTPKALRALRKFETDKRYINFVDEPGYSIYYSQYLGRTNKSWTPRPYRSWVLQNKLENSFLVKNMFSVKQGVRTGNNYIFLLNLEDYKRLPNKEKKYFKPCVVNDSIINGELKKLVYLFYPYYGNEINSETRLKSLIPYYYKYYLKPNETELKKRSLFGATNWWDISRPAKWHIEGEPKIVSTYFGTSGSFAFDNQGEYVVVQGFAWIPKPLFKKFFNNKMFYAYVALLNNPFVDILLEMISDNVQGGQWNLSSKFIEEMPIPNLTQKDIDLRLINELAEIGKKISRNSIVDFDRLVYILKSLLGLTEING